MGGNVRFCGGVGRWECWEGSRENDRKPRKYVEIREELEREKHFRLPLEGSRSNGATKKRGEREIVGST